MPLIKSQYRSIVVLALALASSLPVYQEVGCFMLRVPTIDLKDKSYTLDLYVDSGEVYRDDIQEMHSVWQGRSKLTFKWLNPKKGEEKKHARVGTVYADKTNLLGVLAKDGVSFACQEIDKSFVDVLFGQFVIAGFDSGHLIGAARLLAFVQANQEKFAQITPSGSESGAQSGESSTQIYKQIYEAKFETNGGFTITLFYHEDATQNLPYGIPRMIGIKTISGTLTTLLFKRYQALKEGQLQASMSSAESVGQYCHSDADEVTFDMFAANPSLGCSEAITKNRSYGPYMTHSRFSFIARAAKPGPEEPHELTVVYDPILENYRVDQVYKSRSVTKIADFQANHQYHIVRKNYNAEDSVLAGIFRPEEDHSCVVTRIQRVAMAGNPYTIGQMLLGTYQIAYLGLARVRGIEARVYECHDCDWPIWLQQPSIYLDASDKQKKIPIPAWRNDRVLAKNRGISITSVFYFTKTDPDEYNIAKAKLLLLEIRLEDHKTPGRIIKKHSYSIFDFEWSLPSSSPAGGRYEDTFTLQNECLAYLDHGQYGTIDLLLEAKVEDENLAWVQDRTKRNLALLHWLQQKVLLHPISMVYDFESRLTKGGPNTIPGSDKPFYPISLLVSMKTAARNDRDIELFYQGLVNVNEDYVNTVQLDNFQLCYMLAAHRGVETLFAFRAHTCECFLIKPDVSASFRGDVGELMKAIDTSDRSHTEPADELYLIQYGEKTRRQIDRLRDAEDILEHRENFFLYDPTRAYAEQVSRNVNEVRIKIDVKRAHIIRLDDEIDYYEGEEHHLGVTNKYLGFGLVASDGHNKLVKPASGDDESKIGVLLHQQENEMSFEQCQTACLADFGCRSFSLCNRRGVMSCILSKVDFGTPSIARQIMILSENKSKADEKFSITVNREEQNSLGRNGEGHSDESKEETIQLISHPLCELHNKLYLDLFEFYGFMQLQVTKSTTVLPVANIEQCSEICFQRTLEFLRYELDQLDDAQRQRSSSNKSINKTICDFFYHVDRETIELMEPDSVTLFKKNFAGIANSTKLDAGYCIMDKEARFGDYRTGMNNKDDEPFGKLQLIGQQFAFNYLNLYTKQPAVSMVTTRLSDLANDVLFYNLGVGNPEDLNEIKANENYGKTEYIPDGGSDRTPYCAKECLWPKTRTAYPSCQSFDSFVITNPKKPTRRVCGFNSMTLASASGANRTDLIRTGSDKQERVRLNPMDTVQVWHYELRPGLVADSVEAMYEIQLAEDIRAARASAYLVHIGGFSLFCCLVLMLSLGIAVGITLSSRLLAKSQTLLEEDTNELVENSSVNNNQEDNLERVT